MDYISLNRAGIIRFRQIVNENHLHLYCWVCKLNTHSIIKCADDYMISGQKQPHPDLLYLEQALSPWQSNIMQGNYAFEQGALLDARDKYLLAKTLADHLLQQFLYAQINNNAIYAIEHCIPALVVASHNLADTYIAMQQPENACKWLCEVHLTLCSLIKHTHYDIQKVSMHHYIKTSSELVSFARRYPSLPELIEQVNFCLSSNTPSNKQLH